MWGIYFKGYGLCAATEGKSPKAVAIAIKSVNYFVDFLTSQGISPDVTQINQYEIRVFLQSPL